MAEPEAAPDREQAKGDGKQHVRHRREPLAVQIGETQFALRLIEAECIQVQTVQTGQTANMP